LGEHWLPLVPSLQILAVWGFIRSLAANTGPVLYSIGKPQIITRIQIAQVGLMLLLIYPFTNTWGLTGASVSVVVAALIPNMLAIRLAFYYLSRK